MRYRALGPRRRDSRPRRPLPLCSAAPTCLDAPTTSVSFVFRRNRFLSGDGRLPTGLASDFGDGDQSAT